MDMLKMAASCFSSAIFFLKVAGWGWMGVGSIGLL